MCLSCVSFLIGSDLISPWRCEKLPVDGVSILVDGGVVPLVDGDGWLPGGRVVCADSVSSPVARLLPQVVEWIASDVFVVCRNHIHCMLQLGSLTPTVCVHLPVKSYIYTSL